MHCLKVSVSFRFRFFFGMCVNFSKLHSNVYIYVTTFWNQANNQVNFFFCCFLFWLPLAIVRFVNILNMTLAESDVFVKGKSANVNATHTFWQDSVPLSVKTARSRAAANRDPLKNWDLKWEARWWWGAHNLRYKNQSEQSHPSRDWTVTINTYPLRNMHVPSVCVAARHL